jgi:hypothetical protein
VVGLLGVGGGREEGIQDVRPRGGKRRGKDGGRRRRGEWTASHGRLQEERRLRRLGVFTAELGVFRGRGRVLLRPRDRGGAGEGGVVRGSAGHGLLAGGGSHQEGRRLDRGKSRSTSSDYHARMSHSYIGLTLEG